MTELWVGSRDPQRLSYDNAIVALRGVSMPHSIAAFVDTLRAKVQAMGTGQG